MKRNLEFEAIAADWMARPPERRATAQQASDFAFDVCDRHDGRNATYQRVLAYLRPLVGRD